MLEGFIVGGIIAAMFVISYVMDKVSGERKKDGRR